MQVLDILEVNFIFHNTSIVIFLAAIEARLGGLRVDQLQAPSRQSLYVRH
jgi:hypothetical protein